VKSSIEPLEGNKVKLYVEVEEAEFDRDIDRAFRQIAREVRLPGFRAGKAPRRLLEARIGLGPAREQALRDSVPNYLAQAVREHGVDLIATPEIEITGGQEDGPVEFDATCEVRPEISVPGYGGLRVELPSLGVDDAECDAIIDQELRRHAGLRTVDRPAVTGDFVLVDMTATRDGEQLTGLDPEDWSYEIGQGWVTDDFDEQLVGATAGSVLEFSSVPKGTEEPADFVVRVSAIQELDLPELDDQWVADNLGEYETVSAWRAGIGERLAAMKLQQARSMFVGKLTESLAGLVDEEPPEVMVDAEFRGRFDRTVQQFQAQGIDMGAWLSATGQTPDTLVAAIREQAEQGARVDLALRAVANAENIEVSDEDLEAEYARIAMQVGQKARAVRQAYEQNHAVLDLIAQIRKNRALEWLAHHVEIVDTEGQPIDPDLILAEGEHEHDHDHDHEHDHDHDHADGDEHDEENGEV